MLVFCLVCLVPGQAGLLGAGQGDGSCPAPPFRADTADLAWPEGCPAWASCCTEYGYCHPRTSWEQELFRDCNGESNGSQLPPDTIQAEAEAVGELAVEEAEEVEVAEETEVEVAEVALTAEESGEVLVAAPPLPVIDNYVADYDAPPLTGLYLAPAE